MNTFIWYYGLISIILTVYLLVGWYIYEKLYRDSQGEIWDYWEYFEGITTWPLVLYFWNKKFKENQK